MAKKPSYDARVRNYYGHQAMNLRAREALEAAGVKDKKYLPKADYTMDGPDKRMAESDKMRRKKPVKRAAGGKVTRGDGIAKKGHTKGKMV